MKNKMEPQVLKQQLRETGQYMLHNGLAWGNAGNISARIDAEHFMITASGTDLGELIEGDFAVCQLSQHTQHIASAGSGQAGPRPSKEVPMHQAIYEMRPDIHAVVHAAPFYSTLYACSGEEVKHEWFVEAMYYLERVERVPYHHPGSHELGEAVREKAQKANVLLLENHGVLVYDVSLREARMALHTLEMVCRMQLTARGADISLLPLPESVVNSFLNDSGYRPRRKWNG